MCKFADRLDSLITTNDITNTTLSNALKAEGCSVSDVAIGFWRKGKNEPKASNISALADYFNVTTDYLLGRENEVLSPERQELVNLAQALSNDKVAALLAVAKTIQ